VTEPYNNPPTRKAPKHSGDTSSDNESDDDGDNDTDNDNDGESTKGDENKYESEEKDNGGDGSSLRPEKRQRVWAHGDMIADGSVEIERGEATTSGVDSNTKRTEYAIAIVKSPCLRFFATFTGTDYGILSERVKAPLVTRLTVRNRGGDYGPIKPLRGTTAIPLDIWSVLERFPLLTHLAVSERNIVMRRDPHEKSFGRTKLCLQSLQLSDNRRDDDAKEVYVDERITTNKYQRRLAREDLLQTVHAVELDLTRLVKNCA
jgi:hypothetical protein